MNVIDKYMDARDVLFQYFGYVEDYKAIPVEDSRQYYWRLYGEGPGSVRFADTPELLDDPSANYYEDEIYTQRFLPKWVYRGEHYTMVCTDPHVDGNHFLRIFDNTRCIPPSEGE